MTYYVHLFVSREIRSTHTLTTRLYHRAMLWEHKINTVVMMTGLEEGGRAKCERYWPFEGKSMENDFFQAGPLPVFGGDGDPPPLPFASVLYKHWGRPRLQFPSLTIPLPFCVLLQLATTETHDCGQFILSTLELKEKASGFVRKISHFWCVDSKDAASSHDARLRFVALHWVVSHVSSRVSSCSSQVHRMA